MPTILVLQIEEAGDTWSGWVLDNFPKNLSEMETLQEAGIMPDILFCLRDGDGHQGTRQQDKCDSDVNLYACLYLNCVHVSFQCVAQF